MEKYNYLYIDPQADHGVGEYAYSLMKNMDLTDRGYVTNVRYDYPSIQGVTNIPIFDYLDKHGLKKGISYLKSLLRLYFILINNRPKLVHINWIRMPYVEYLYYFILKALLGFKLIYTAHNVLPHGTGDKYKTIYTLMYKLADIVIVHSKYTQSEIENLGVKSDKLRIIKHGAFGNNSMNKDTIFDFREKYGLNNKIIFALIGVQNPYKGTDIAINAWISSPELCRSKDCCLVIMGKNSGVDYSEAEKIKNILIIDKFYTDEENLSILNATDVLILPYRSISQSGVLLSALAYHIPVIVSKVGGLAETLEEANIGWTIEKEDISGLETVLKSIIEKPSRINYIKNNGKEWDKILRYYSWEDIGKKTKELYLSLTNN